MIKKLDSKLFYKILNEELSGLMSEEGDGMEFSQSGNNGVNPTIKEQLIKYTEKLEPEAEAAADQEIKFCSKYGKSNLDYKFYQKNKISFLYITDSLALMAKEGNDKSRNALMDIFSPYSKEQSLEFDKNQVTKMSAFYYEIKNIFMQNQSSRNTKDIQMGTNFDDVDMFLDSFIDSFDKCISNFSPENGSFNSLLSFAVSNKIIDKWRKKFYMIGGQRVKKQDSLDDKLSSDDQDSDTIGSKVANDLSSDQYSVEKKHDKEWVNKVWGFINSAIEKVLSKNPNYLEIYKMYSLQNMDLEEMANKLGIAYNNLRIAKMRAEDLVLPYISKIEDSASKLAGQKVTIPLIKGKGSDKQRFVFPRIGGKKGLEELFVIKDNCIILELNQFYNESEILSEEDFYKQNIVDAFDVKEKLEKLEEFYNKIYKSLLKINEGSEVDTIDMFTHVKAFVEEATKIIYALYGEIHKIENVAYEISGEYKNIAEDISQVIDPIIEQLELWPHKLQAMLGRIRISYNPTSAYGL